MKKTKVLALVLAIAMILCALPMNAMAADDVVTNGKASADGKIEWELDGKTLVFSSLKSTSTVINKLVDKDGNALDSDSWDNLYKTVEEIVVDSDNEGIEVFDLALGGFENAIKFTFGAFIFKSNADITVSSIKTANNIASISLAKKDDSNATTLAVADGSLVDNKVKIVVATNATTKIAKAITSVDYDAFKTADDITSLTIETGSALTASFDLSYNEKLTEFKMPKKNFNFDLDDFFSYGDKALKNLTVTYTDGTTMDFGYSYILGEVLGVNLPNTVKEIDFDYIRGIKYITVADGNKYFASKDNCVYTVKKFGDYEKGTLVFGTAAAKIPAEVSIIGEYAFYNSNRSNLSQYIELEIPSTVEEIQVNAFAGNCKFKSITLPTSVTVLNDTAIIYSSAVKYQGTKADALKITRDGKKNYVWSSDEDVSNYIDNCNWSFVSSFTDVNAKEWYADAVEYVTDKKYMKGYADGKKFGVGDNFTRQDFVCTLANIYCANNGYDYDDLADMYDVDILDKFSDVKKDDYYAPALAWAYAKELVSGYADGKFGGADPITREQLLVIFCKYLNANNNSLSTKVDIKATYKDADSISAWAYKYVAWAVNAGVISGTSKTTIAPQAKATREQVAQILYNYYEPRTAR